MAKCKSYQFGGVGACDALREKVRAIIPMTKGTVISKANAIIVGSTDASGWCSVLAPKVATSTYETGVIIDMYRGVEVTTAAAEMGTSNLGFIEQVGPQMPRMTGYGKMSYSEYMGYFDAHGKTFDFAIVLHNGDLLMTPSGSSYKGMRGRMFVTQGSIPKVGADLQKENFFDIIFDDPEEWLNLVEVSTNFTFSELLDICPAGLDAVVTTAYSSPNVTIKVTKRNSDEPFTGVAAAANIQIVQAWNDAVCAVSSVTTTSSAIGSYPVVLTASLNGPVYARITAEDSNKRTYVSKLFRIV